MEAEKVKKILGKYKKLMRMAETLDRQARELGDRAEAMGSKKIYDMPRGGKRVTMEDLLAEKADLERRRNGLLKRALEEKTKVQQYIDRVESEKHNRLLYGLYLQDMSVEDVADAEGYSVRQEWRIYKEAHKIVEKIICQ